MEIFVHFIQNDLGSILETWKVHYFVECGNVTLVGHAKVKDQVLATVGKFQVHFQTPENSIPALLKSSIHVTFLSKDMTFL